MRIFSFTAQEEEEKKRAITLIKEIYILTNRSIHIKLNLTVPYKIQGANKGGRLSDFSAQPPTSCRNINSNISLWLR